MLFEKNKNLKNEEFEVGDVLINAYGRIWMIVKSFDDKKFNWVSLSDGIYGEKSYKTIKELINNEFEDDYYETKISNTFTLIKNSNLKLTEIN